VEEIIGDERRERVVSKLHEILRPFLLRRLKHDVLLNLPSKREIVLYAPLSSLQKEYYFRAKDRTLKGLLIGLGIEGASSLSSENVLMQQRKVCSNALH
jgi:ATP-dependent DNA helicase